MKGEWTMFCLIYGFSRQVICVDSEEVSKKPFHLLQNLALVFSQLTGCQSIHHSMLVHACKTHPVCYGVWKHNQIQVHCVTHLLCLCTLLAHVVDASSVVIQMLHLGHWVSPLRPFSVIRDWANLLTQNSPHGLLVKWKTHSIWQMGMCVCVCIGVTQPCSFSGKRERDKCALLKSVGL